MKKMSRTWFFCLFVGWTLSFFHLPVGAFAADMETARTAALVEGAKKEGKLLWYSTMNILDVATLLRKFREKYPFIATESYKAGSEIMLTKILAEAASNKMKCDLIMNTGQETLVMQKKGLFAKYVSPQSKFFPEGLKDPEGYWNDVYVNLNVMGYNTKLVSPRDVPRSYQDLLDPKWRGMKIALDVKAFDWFANVLKIMGEEKGLAYMKKLADQDLKFYSNRTVLAQMVAAGEVALSPAVYNQRAEEMKAKGAPIDWTGIETVVTEIHPIAVSAFAPHPNSAKLFVDFILSREGQEIVASFYRIPSRLDVDPLNPRLKKGLKLAPFDPKIAENYDKYAKLYREILMKK